MTSTLPRIVALGALTLAVGCASIKRAQDRRLAEWQASSITVDEATRILGTAPYAVPGFDIVAIHADRTGRVVMVEQRIEAGTLIALSQHRGQYIPPMSRGFVTVERVAIERVPYASEYPAFDRYYEQVEPGGRESAEEQLRNRRLTRLVGDDLTIRLWGGRVPEQRPIALLNSAEPIEH